MYRFALLAALVGFAAADCGFPNGTDTTLNWWQGATTGKVTFTKATPVEPSGQPEYPIRLKEALRVQCTMDNEESEMVGPNLRMSVKIYQYGGWTGCSWTEVPTFGLLNDLDACTQGVPCPVKMGNQDLLVTLDFTKYSAIISLLKNDAPYQLELTLTDKSNGKYVTLVAQARALTK